MALALAREQRELPAAVNRAQDKWRGLETEREDYEASLRQLRLERDTAAQARRGLQATEREAVAGRDAARLDFERAAVQNQLHQEQLANLRAQREQTFAAEAQLASQIDSLTAAAAEIAEAAQAIASQTLDSTPEALNTRLAEQQTQAAVSARAISDATARLNEMQTALDRAAAAVQARKDRLAAVTQESENFLASLAEDRVQLSNLQAQLSSWQAKIDQQQSEISQLETERLTIESAETEIRTSLHASERRHAELQLDFARKKDEIEALRRQITDDFGLVTFDYTEEMAGPTPLPLEGVVEHLPQVETLPEGLEDLLNRRRSQLKRMGAINPDALIEFNEVRERHDFLVAQVADLEKAAAQLREVIAELDALMEREFRRTFDAVAEQFKETFSRLFGGGTAKLILTEPENLTNTGIDILAKLPGRKQQGLALLSGGERALTASALLFALLKVNPPPFAMLDEVDAALDEANVGRFRDLLRELGQTTQFIVITHNRNTVQAADTVYGISMGADSASQAISLKLDGEKVAQA